MRRTLKPGWLLGLLFGAAFLNFGYSQDLKKELEEFMKKFEASYNKQDDKALKSMHTANAVRTDQDGTVTTGNENIRQLYAESWANVKLKVTIKQDKVEKQKDGSVLASGTYHVTGSTNSGEIIDAGGAFVNTVVKEEGKWKISKMVLSNL